MKAKIIIILSFILAINLLSQPNKFQQSRNYIGMKNDESFFTNIIALPSNNNDSMDIYLCYTFSYIDLVFQKTDDNNYFAIPEIEVTFKDSEGITRKRFISNDTIVVNDYKKTQQKTTHRNVAQFSLANNNYKVVSKFNNSKNRTLPIEHSISKYSDDNKLVNMFILPSTQTDEVTPGTTPYSPFGSNNNCVSFYSNNFTIFIPTKSKNRDYTFSIEKVENKNELNWKHFRKIEGIAVYKREENNVDRWYIDDNYYTNYRRHNFNFSDFITISFFNSNKDYSDLRTYGKFLYHTFIPGKYILTISDNNNTKTQFHFEVKWYNMPQSLRDPFYALEQMHLILTDEEYKNMKDKDKNVLFANIMNYWERYITYLPRGNYGKEMIEFFDRVDYAEINFRTLTQKEGAKSDRGKVYILNGEPDEITTNTKDKKTNEIWHYNQLNKKYIFEIVSVGNYKLVSIEE